MGALGAFFAEMLLAGRGLRADVAVGRSEAEAETESPEPNEDGHNGSEGNPPPASAQ